MAITLTQEKKKQKNMMVVLSLVIFATLVVIWFSFFRNKTTPVPEVVLPQIYSFPQVKIDWQLLENIRGNATAQPVEEIIPFSGNFGRSNPFISY